jgi:hypothetical protein
MSAISPARLEREGRPCALPTNRNVKGSDPHDFFTSVRAINRSRPMLAHQSEERAGLKKVLKKRKIAHPR